jgi:glycine betaine/proline transport system substrate-binding protein
VKSSENGMLAKVKRSHPMNNPLQMHNLDGGDEFFGPNYGGATV